MKPSIKKYIIFISTFLGVIVTDYLFFVGIFSQIPTEKTAWLLDNFILSIILCFLLFLGLPCLISYYVAFKVFKAREEQLIEPIEILNRKSQINFALIATFAFAILLFIFFKTAMQPQFTPYTFHEIKEGELAGSSVMPSPSADMFSPTPTTFPTGPYQPTPTTTIGVTPTNTPTPARTPNPPLINISYPSEMQSIEMGATQTLCVVDVPAGGDTSGLQRRHNINDQGWSGYVNHFTLCFDPKEGLNRISLQYKNSFGDESVVYTRQFNFHRLENITVTISGQIYRDENCNGVRNTGESNISVSTIVRMFKIPEFYIYGEVNSNSSGSFSFSTTIREDESITLQPIVQSPSGYKSNPNYESPSFTLNSSNRNASLDYPQVPNEFVGTCSS